MALALCLKIENLSENFLHMWTYKILRIQTRKAQIVLLFLLSPHTVYKDTGSLQQTLSFRIKKMTKVFCSILYSAFFT